MDIQTFTRVTQNTEKRPYPIRLPEKKDIASSTVLFLLSRAAVMGMFPFAPAFFAAVYDKQTAYLGIAVMLAGLLSKGAGLGCVKYIFCALIFWLFTQIKKPNDNQILASSVCGGGVLLCGGILLPYTNPSIYGVLTLVAESILTAFLYVVFDKAHILVTGRAKRTQIGQEELVCLAVCIGGVITGFSGIPLPYGLSLAHLFTMYAVMSISMHMNLGMACTGGLILGFLTGMDSHDAILYMGLFGFCGVFGNLLKSFGKTGVGLGFLGASAVALLYVGNIFSFPVKLAEVLTSVIVFMIMPKKVHYMAGAFLSRSLHMDTIRADIRVKEYLADRLRRISASFKKLEESFFAVTEKRIRMQTNEVADMFDAVADKVCQSCGMCRQCWQSGFSDTYRQMYAILDTIETKGYCDSANVPPLFKDQCVRLESFLGEFAHMYELYKQKAVWEGESITGRDLMAKQYGEVSQIMDKLSGEVSGGFSFLEELENKVVEEFDKNGFAVREVSIIENGLGALEAYLTLGLGANVKAVCEELSTILDTPMELDEMHGSICKFLSSSVYSIEVGTRQKCKDGQKICGDTLVHFKTDDNKYCVLLCDGMGSGPEAGEESMLASTLLEEFLRAGFGRETAVEMINSALTLKMDKETFSTIDLFVFDMMTGVGEFYKVGGAESFIKKGSDIEAVFSKTLPAGMLEDISTESIRRVFSGGEVIVMATDGITESGTGIIRGEWIKRTMSEDTDMDDLANEILTGAEKKSGTYIKDDMSVAAIKIKKTA